MEKTGNYGTSSGSESKQLISEISSLCRAIANKPRAIIYLQKLRDEAKAYANYKSHRGNDPRRSKTYGLSEQIR